jgi:Putative MetA-pathway of phenol degradation
VRQSWCVYWLAGLLELILGTQAHAQTNTQLRGIQATAPPQITSNRPGIAESEALMMPGAWQVESGVTVSASTDDGVDHRQWTIPELTLRAGLTRRVEVFLNATGFVLDVARDTGTSATTTGVSDVQLNAKLGLLTENSNVMTLSVAAGVSFPTGATVFSSGGYDPSLRVLWSKDLAGNWYIGGNIVLADTTIEERRTAAGGVGVSTGHAISGAWSWYVELFGNITQRDSSLWRLDGGVAIVTRPDLQFDVSAGRAVLSGSGAWFVSAGVSYRFRRSHKPRQPSGFGGHTSLL